MESDPFRLFPDRERLRKAFKQLDLLIVMDYLPSEAERDADFFLPTRTLFEAETLFVNQEARAQFSPPAHCGGIPIEQLSGGDHPPRVFRSDIPGNQPRTAWQILLELGNLLTLPGEWKALSREDLLKRMREEDPLFADLQDTGVSSAGVRLLPSQGKGTAFSSEPGYAEKNPAPVGSLEVLLVDRTFGTEELSCYSPYIGQAESPPSLLMHPADAKDAGLRNGDKVILHLEGGPLEIELTVAENMAQGVIVLPRDHRLDWQKIKTLPARITIDRIEKR